MIPNSPARDQDETAASGSGLAATPSPEQTVAGGHSAAPASGAADTTAASGAADATVVRASPSAPTLSDLSGSSSPNSFGRYELLGEIARGGMGVVHRARQRGLERLVALKMVLGTDSNDESSQRFLQEARAAAALDHPNVVPIYDIGENNGRPYFTMALVEGPNLRGYVESRGTLPIPEVVTLFAQVVEGVAHAHQNGIIHRDLKPANVLMDKDGRPRVTDFGLAKRTAVDSNLTATGQVVGTPSYMAPEQARDSKDVGPPADVYALGAILYFLLTGRPPFTGESFTDLLIKVVSDAPIPPRQLRTDVPEEIEAFCLRCLAKNPAERFPNADALAIAFAPITYQYHQPSATSRSSPIRVNLTRPSFGTTPELSALVAAGSLATRGDSASTAGLPTAPPKPTAAPAPTVPPPAAPGAASVADLGPAPVPARDRRPVLFGLGALALVLVALLGYLALRGDKPTETAKTDPATGAKPDGPPNPVPPGPPLPPGSGQGPPPVVPPPANAGDRYEWPPSDRADFGLKIEVGEKQDPAGVYQMSSGQKLTLRLTAEKDCRVTVWYREPGGRVTCLFPNEYESNDRLTAGQMRVVPGNDDYSIKTTATEGPGLDRLRVIATTGKPLAIPPGTKAGPFTSFESGEEREKLASGMRRFILEGKAASIVDQELRFRVAE